MRMDDESRMSRILFIEELVEADRSLKMLKASGYRFISSRGPSWNAKDLKLLKYRLLSKSEPEGECWIFHGAKTQKGYGHLKVGGRKNTKQQLAHRLAYAIFVGEIPEGKMVCHRCDVRNCINPKHLYVGTALENNRDREARGRRNVKGERHPRAKLTETDIKRIRLGGKSDAEFGREYGVDRALIRRIRLRTQWTHVE